MASRNLTRKIEKGHLFDPEANIPFYNNAILLCRIIGGAVMEKEPSISDSIPVAIRDKLIGYEYQVYRGPNSTAAPNCVNPFLSIFGFTGDDISAAAWSILF